MLRLADQDKSPSIPADTRIAPNAVVSGDVSVGHNCSIGFGALLTAESGPIRIGDNCVVMDGAVLRGVRGNPLRTGDNVLVGPHAYLTGCTIEQNVFHRDRGDDLQRRCGRRASYVLGVARPEKGETMMPDVMRRYARFLVRRHGRDG